jgi:CRISPR-associated protein (TIGR03986 family)
MSFVNPYNFVSLRGKCEKKDRPIPVKTEENEPLYTGVLYCTLTTKTPLFIPNTTNEDTFPKLAEEELKKYNDRNSPKSKGKSQSYDFYSYTDNSETVTLTESPVIPGASIRGLIRSVYETVTNSCLSTSGGKETPLYRRTGVPKTDYGVIKDGKLYAAEKLLIYSDNPKFTRETFPGNLAKASNMKMGQEVCFNRTVNEYSKYGPKYSGVAEICEDGKELGYYLKSELFGTSKHFDAIMLPDFSKEIYALKERDNERLKTLLKLYTHDKGGVNQTKDHNEYRGFLQAEVKPVYYSNVGGDKYYISPACFTKEVFDRSVESILKSESQGKFDACKSSKNLCEACHLFGMVGKGGEGEVDARSSRVQFRDALPTESDGYMGKLTTMAILESPKITAAEFYMEKPDDCDIYNYDYKSSYDKTARKMIPKLLSDGEVRLRGRKFYWHHGTSPKSRSEKDKPNPCWIVRPVKAEREFEFTVAFERLTADELGKLRYSLELEENHYEKTSKQAHKFGHGKPIGYGSVQIGVDEQNSKIYSVNEDLEIVEVDLTADGLKAAGSKYADLPDKLWSYSYDQKEFLALTDFDGRRSNIAYPTGKTEEKTRDETQEPYRINSRTTRPESIYQWFTLNKEATGGGSNSTDRPKLKYTLPSAENPKLKEITKIVYKRKLKKPNGEVIVKKWKDTEYI